MKKLAFIIILVVLGPTSYGQTDTSLTLVFCHDQAVKNHPLAKQFELLNKSSELQTKNIGKNYLPDMAINGQMHYQSDVTKVPSKVPIPELQIQPIDKDWYKISLDVNQLIYDGGFTKHNKGLEAFDYLIDEQNVKISLYDLKKQVNKVYLNILLLHENQRLLKVHQSAIEDRLKEMDSRIRHGVILQSNADVLNAELLKVHQKLIEVRIAVRTNMQVLAELTSTDIPENTALIIPEMTIDLPDNQKKRLEYGLMAFQQSRLEEMKKLANANLLPKFYGFGQLGYGRPGYDMLNNNFDDFYMIGFRMNWRFWNWNKSRNEKEILELNKSIISTQIETFDKNLRIETDRCLAEILKFEELISKDREILELRSKIARTYAAQMENGVITATEYLTELRAETEAKLDLEKHKLELINAKLEYLTTIGEL